MKYVVSTIYPRVNTYGSVSCIFRYFHITKTIIQLAVKKRCIYL